MNRMWTAFTKVASLSQKQKVLSSAVSRAENVAKLFGFKKFTMENNDYSIRKHYDGMA